MKLALFDLDKTLIPEDSDYGWGQYLVRAGHVDAEHYARENLRFYEAYTAGTLDILEYSHFVFAVLQAHPMAVLHAWRAEFAAQQKPIWYTPQAQALVNQHLSAGDVCLLVSATNRFVIEPIAQWFGFEHIIGTNPECINGAFTGRVEGIPSFQEGKIARVEAWLAELGWTWADFDTTVFYSDSMNDLPLMQRVSEPVAVNPDARLRAWAQKNNWQVVDLFVQNGYGVA